MIQNIIVALIVALCTAYVLRKFVFKRKGSSLCDGCGKCGGKQGGCH